MTKQEILDEFNDINYVYNNSSKHETLSWMLDELLKEPEAVEPVLDADKWACGNCNHPVEHDYLVGPNVWFHELHNFCPFCGKKLDWVDKEIK